MTTLPIKPTLQAYGELEHAFDMFNTTLFEGSLPPCLLTLQREKTTAGYFSENRFANLDGTKVHEIAMNPGYFAIVPIVEVMQTLVHEMTHLWQKHLGTPSRGRYHNAEWANKMEAIGLMPSSTGKPGGLRTGDRVADYALPGGRFLQACELLLTQNFKISWYDRFPPESSRRAAMQVCAEHAFLTVAGKPSAVPVIPADDRLTLTAVSTPSTQSAVIEKKSTRTKYVCGCANAVWGKPELNILCCECHAKYEPQT